MAAAIETDMVTGTRRAVVPSERFMEWQRQLSSSRGAYGGRKRYEGAEGVEINAGKKHCGKRQVNEDNASKPHRGSKERDGEADGLVEGQMTKIKKQQHQGHRLDAKSLQKEHDHESRKEVVKEGKVSADPVEAESGRLCKCKQQGSQAGHLAGKQELQSRQVQQRMSLKQTVNRRRQRRMPRSGKERVEQKFQSLKRTRRQENILLPDLPTSIGIKRSSRVAQRLVHEEPVSPPLKLPKLQLVLTRKEIQEDWMKITGHRYPGKPKKSTLVQQGLGLCTSLTCPSSIRYLSNP